MGIQEINETDKVPVLKEHMVHWGERSACERINVKIQMLMSEMKTIKHGNVNEEKEFTARM